MNSRAISRRLRGLVMSGSIGRGELRRTGRQHPGREVHRDHVACLTGEPPRVLPRAGTELEHGPAAYAQRRAAQHQRVEIAGGITIIVVLRRPAIIALRNPAWLRL